MKDIAELIPYGSEHAISMKDLSMYLNCGEREARRIIKNARLAGEVICGDSSGYYRPVTVEELKGYYQLTRERVATTRKCLAAVYKELKNKGVEADEHKL